MVTQNFFETGGHTSSYSTTFDILKNNKKAKEAFIIFNYNIMQHINIIIILSIFLTRIIKWSNIQNRRFFIFILGFISFFINTNTPYASLNLCIASLLSQRSLLFIVAFIHKHKRFYFLGF